MSEKGGAGQMGHEEGAARTEPEIQRAEPAAQRRAAIVAVVLAVLGGLAIILAERMTSDIADRSGEELRQASEMLGAMLRGLAVTLWLVLTVLAAWIAGVATRAYRFGRFPPPGHQVARDTRVLRGPDARRRALVSFGLAALLFFGGLASLILVWRLVGSLAAI